MLAVVLNFISWKFHGERYSIFFIQRNWSTERQGACPRLNCRSGALPAWNPGSHGLEFMPSQTGLERLSDGPECVWEGLWFSFGWGRVNWIPEKEVIRINDYLSMVILKELYFLLALILKLSLGLLFSWMGTGMISENDFWRYNSGTSVQWQTGHSGRDQKGRYREQTSTEEASAGLQWLGAEVDVKETQGLSHAKV